MPSTLVTLDLVGILVFAMSGALVAVRKELDVFGVLVLAGTTGLGGGFLRDVLAGAAIAVAGTRADLPVVAVAFAGAGVCLVWRLLAMWRGWQAPMPTGPASV